MILTPVEYNLLCYFLQNPESSSDARHDPEFRLGYELFPNTRTVDGHVVRLRQKLELDVNTPKHFLTVHGVGYRFVPQGAIGFWCVGLNLLARTFTSRQLRTHMDRLVGISGSHARPGTSASKMFVVAGSGSMVFII